MNWEEIPQQGDNRTNVVRCAGLGLFRLLSDETIFRIIKLLPDHDVLQYVFIIYNLIFMFFYSI